MSHNRKPEGRIQLSSYFTHGRYDVNKSNNRLKEIKASTRVVRFTPPGHSPEEILRQRELRGIERLNSLWSLATGKKDRDNIFV